MQYSNLHNHTIFSDGKCTVEENIQAAIAKGMASIGFSDHSYLPWGERYCIAKARIPEYIAEVRAMQAKYKDQIEVYLGLEQDVNSALNNRSDYDYIIGDLHDVCCEGEYYAVDSNRETMQYAIDTFFGGDATAYAKAYFADYAEKIAELKPDVLGHIDLVTKFSLMNEEDPAYLAAAKETLIASLEVTPIIELNTGAISRGHRPIYPAVYLLDEVKAHGGKITLTADSHHVEHLTFYFDEAREIMKSRGINSMLVYKGGQFEEVGI